MTQDPVVHPRGGDAANPGRYSERTQPDGAVSLAASDDEEPFITVDRGPNRSDVEIDATGRERCLEVLFRAPGDDTLVVSTHTPWGEVVDSAFAVPFSGEPADFQAFNQTLSDAAELAGKPDVRGAMVNSGTKNLEVSVLFDKDGAATDIEITDRHSAPDATWQTVARELTSDTLHIVGDPKTVLRRLRNAWEAGQEDWRSRGDEDDEAAWESFDGWDKSSDVTHVPRPGVARA